MSPPVRLYLLFCLFILTSCGNNSNFSSSGANEKTPAEDDAASSSKDEDKSSESKADDRLKADADPSTKIAFDPAMNAGSDTSTSSSISTAPPEDAVTKGSFTAWAEPKNPMPGQPYWILIEVRLPPDVKSYAAADISGRLLGTDGYSRGVGRDSKGPTDGLPLPLGVDASLIPTDKFDFNGTSAKLGIWVPGAAELVRDTINIRSDLLNETQSIAIVFQ